MTRTHWSKFIHTLDKFFKRQAGWWSLAVAVLLLRLPTLCEPYWYGDEGIYLTIGIALRQGKLMYAQIVDHKTPLIYYLAMVPSQFWFRMLMLVWMMAATWFFYKLVSTLGWKRWQLWISCWLFVILTNLTAFEANIPNGELFVMGFVLAGWAALSHTKMWLAMLADPRQARWSEHWSRHDILFTLLAGFLASLGLLTKVPALFDIAAMGWVGWLAITANLVTSGETKTSLWVRLRETAIHWVWLGIGIATPVVLSIAYYWWRGSLTDYLQFGLLYNFHYAGNWTLNLPWPILTKIFTLPGKAAILGLCLVVITVWQKWQSRVLSWSLGWLLLALFASLLSNRPYPHYFLQLAPPLSIVLPALAWEWRANWHFRRWGDRAIASITMLLSVSMLLLLPAALYLLHFGLYPTVSYYQRYYRLLTGQITKDQYYQSFGSIMADNAKAADIIRSANTPEIFIWGTNPVLYALSQTSPTGRFTVAFHIKDLNAYPETMADLQSDPPRFIVVMNDEKDSWPELNSYLMEKEYQPNYDFTYFTLWKRPNP